MIPPLVLEIASAQILGEFSLEIVSKTIVKLSLVYSLAGNHSVSAKSHCLPGDTHDRATQPYSAIHTLVSMLTGSWLHIPGPCSQRLRWLRET